MKEMLNKSLKRTMQSVYCVHDQVIEQARRFCTKALILVEALNSFQATYKVTLEVYHGTLVLETLTHTKIESKKLKGTCVICVSENLLLRKHAKRKFLSLVINTSQETMCHYLRIQKVSALTLSKKNFFFNFSSTHNCLFLFHNHQKISKLRQ